MATTHGARPTVPWWRWRDNPLCRRSDVAEAWLMIATVVLALVLSGFAIAAAGAVGTSSTTAANAPARSRPCWSRTRATPPPRPCPERRRRRMGRGALDRPDGTRHTGRAEVPADGEKGDKVTVHTDAKGRLVSAPPEGAEAGFQIAMAGITVAFVTSGMVLLVGWIARARLRLRRLDLWEAEWRQVEPTWRRRMTG
ncbi:hypothetical protein ACFQV4_28305 [Streptomyces thermocarboxydus]